jgi:class 3 adenylate cyclase/tetratricopeptide (TPR) repeat protein
MQAVETPSPERAQLRGERRRVTAILADVKGSTALAERIDVERWVEIMNRVFQILGTEIYRYGGEIDQYRGDGLLAFFGLPTAHEDDPERAVLAALAMQDEIKRYAEELSERERIELLLRVGVNTGEVIAASLGDGRQHREETAMGRAVALAARMETACEPGTVLVTEDTYRLVSAMFEWQALGEIAVKGVSEPLAAYRPLARAVHDNAITGRGRGTEGLSSPLVGRDAEVRALREAVERLQSGVGGIVTVVGEAGIGKSRLVAEVRTGVGAVRTLSGISDEPPLQWVEGHCLSYDGSIAYQLWLDMLRGILNVAPDAPPPAVHDALRERVLTLCPGLFDRVYPYLARLMSLSLEEEYETARNLQGESLKARVFAAVETLIESAAQGRPLVIVCEDLHWADATSLALLERLFALTDRIPLLFVCAFRPGTEHDLRRIRETAARLYHHTDLPLAPLSKAESEVLMDNLLRAARTRLAGIEGLSQELGDNILSRSEGNPLYVEELLRSLVESGDIVCDEIACRWEAARSAAEISVPNSLHGVIVARMDRLPRETRRILRLASVIGQVFARRMLEAIVTEEQRNGLDTHLLILQRAQMIRERAGVPEPEYTFKHVLIQETAYSGLLRRECRAIHRRVAQALERLYPDHIEELVDLLAHHWGRAEEPDAKRAVAYRLRAGDQARIAYANEEAIAHFRQALELIGPSRPNGYSRPTLSAQGREQAWRLEALKGLGQVYLGVGKVNEAEDALREAIALGQKTGLPSREMVRLYHWLGESLWWQNRNDEQIRVGENGLALLGDDSESVEAVLMNEVMASGHFSKGNAERCRECTYRTAQFIRRLPYVEELRPAYLHIAVVQTYVDKNPTKAMAWLRTLRQRAEPHHDLRALGEVHGWAGRILAARGDLYGAVSRHRRALELFSRTGDASLESWSLRDMGKAFLSLGDLRDAQECATRGLKAAETAGNRLTVGQARWCTGQILLCQGAWEEAVEALQKAVQPVEEKMDYRWGEAYALGRAHLAQGNRGQAIERFQEIMALAGSETLSKYTFEFASALSGLEEACGDPGAFRVFCRRFQAGYPETQDSPLVQWYLEPVDVGASHQRPTPLQDGFVAGLTPDWTWADPFDDCSYTVRDGLEMHAANGRHLWRINLSAPRLLRPASEDLAAQTKCGPISGDEPAIGGLLLWKDEQHYLHLDWGILGKSDVSFMGCVDNRDVVIGRGRSPLDGLGRIHLRLERIGDEVSAFCSADGENWFTVGDVTFAVEDPIQVGVHALGNIDRSVYHGAYPEGTAIRFESFQLWRT